MFRSPLAVGNGKVSTPKWRINRQAYRPIKLAYRNLKYDNGRRFECPTGPTNRKGLCPTGIGLCFFVFTENFLGLAVDNRYDLHDRMYLYLMCKTGAAFGQGKFG